MKLLFYISTIRGGGAGRVLSNLANYMVHKGHDVCFVTNFPSETDYVLDDRVDRRNIEDYEGQYKKSIHNFVRISALFKVIREYKPDVCLSFMGENNVRLLLANLFLGRKCIVSVRNDPNKEYRLPYMRIIAKVLYSCAAGIVFQTQDAKEWFSKKIQSKSVIIYNAVADEFFRVDNKNVKKNLVAMGRLTEQKNYHLLIRAFSKIVDSVDDNLLIYGDGKLREQLQKEINILGLNKRVILMGLTNKVAEVLSQSKAFVMSSNYEGMPNALMEALAVGVPSISTDCPCGGPKMLITNGVNGILVPVGDEIALSKEIKRVLTDSDFAIQLGKNAKIEAQNYRPEVIFKQWETYIQGVANHEN